MDIGFKNHLPEFLRTPEVRNAGSMECRMCGAGSAECRENAGSAERKAGSAECRENAGCAERNAGSAERKPGVRNAGSAERKRVKMAKKIQISEERPNSEFRKSELRRKNGMLGKSIFT